MRIATSASVVVWSSWIENGLAGFFWMCLSSAFPAILSVLSVTVLLDSGTVPNVSATCGPHSISAILMQTGLISISPMLCGFVACAIRREHSKDATVAGFWLQVRSIFGLVCDHEFPFSEEKLSGFIHRLRVFSCLVSLQPAGFQTFVCQFLTAKDAFGSNLVHCSYEAKLSVTFLAPPLFLFDRFKHSLLPDTSPFLHQLSDDWLGLISG